MKDVVPEKAVVQYIDRVEEYSYACVLLISLGAADLFIYLAKAQNLLTFDWKLGGSVTIGSILILVVVVALLVAVVFPIFELVFFRPAVLWALSVIPETKSSIPALDQGLVLLRYAREHALTHRDQFLLALVEKEDEKIKSQLHDSAQLSRLIFSVLCMVAFNAYVGWSDYGTLFWTFAGTWGRGSGWNIIIVGSFWIILVLGREWMHTQKRLFELSIGDTYLDYPPLAQEIKNSREAKAAARTSVSP